MPVEIKRRIGAFLVYTKEEADATGIGYVPFRKITAPTAEAGDWALTDDAFVAEILTCRTYTDHRGTSKTFMRLSFGAVWVPRRKQFLFKPFHESGHYGATSPTSWAVREVRLERTLRTVRVYAAMLVTQGSVDWDVLSQTYRPTQPVKTVKKLFREPRVQELVQRELQKAYTGSFPISAEEIVILYKRLFEAAQKDKDYRICKDILETFLHFLGP